MDFATRVSGIPCLCRVHKYYPGTHRLITSQSLEPNDEEEFEYSILDRRGKPAAWLERKLTADDDNRLLAEYFDQ